MALIDYNILKEVECSSVVKLEAGDQYYLKPEKPYEIPSWSWIYINCNKVEGVQVKQIAYYSTTTYIYTDRESSGLLRVDFSHRDTGVFSTYIILIE